jgi:predicted oxidoreductase
MKLIKLGKSDLQSSVLVYGCMRIIGDGSSAHLSLGKKAVYSAIEAGYNHFDHADIYGNGECEKLFGEILKENSHLREKIIITGKCGIRQKGSPQEAAPARYDFSKDYIIKSVESSLSRLHTDRLDILLLHRADFLIQPQETANAFSYLKESGKVRYFGVSNFRASKISLLQSYLNFPLIVNQIELNMHNVSALYDDTIDYCHQFQVSPQAWSPLKGAAYPADKTKESKEREARIKTELDRQAKKYQSQPWVIVLAWLLKHPSGTLPIIGSTNIDRITASTSVLKIKYSREDWYRLLEARNGYPVP